MRKHVLAGLSGASGVVHPKLKQWLVLTVLKSLTKLRAMCSDGNKLLVVENLTIQGNTIHSATGQSYKDKTSV